MREIRIRNVPEELVKRLTAEGEQLGLNLRSLALLKLWGTEEGQNGDRIRTNSPSRVPKEPNKLELALREVWEYYIRVIGRQPKLYTFTPKRKAMGLARLKDDLLPRAKSLEAAVGVMKLCVDRLKGSAYHNGQNDRGVKYLDWEILFRSTEKLEFWLDDQRWLK